MAEDLSKKFYVHNFGTWKAAVNAKRFSDKKLEVKVIERGIILPLRRINSKEEYEGGVCDNDFNFVAGYYRREPEEMIRGGHLLLRFPILSTEKNSSNLMKM